MDTNNVRALNAVARIRIIELFVYAVFAALFIGHVFFINGPVESINVLLILIGTVFGFMAAFQLAPFADLADKGTRISAQILTIVREENTQSASSVDNKRAA